MDVPTNPVRGKNVFLSGPMSGMPDLNRDAFARAEARVRELGARVVFNPCEWWRQGGEQPDWTSEQFMRADLHLLTASVDGVTPTFDVLVALPGHRQRAGSRAEVMAAEMSGITLVRYSDLLGVVA